MEPERARMQNAARSTLGRVEDQLLVIANEGD